MTTREYICHVPLPESGFPFLRIRQEEDGELHKVIHKVIMVGDAGSKPLYEGVDALEAARVYDYWVGVYETRKQAGM